MARKTIDSQRENETLRRGEMRSGIEPIDILGKKMESYDRKHHSVASIARTRVTIFFFFFEKVEIHRTTQNACVPRIELPIFQRGQEDQMNCIVKVEGVITVQQTQY